MLMNGVDRPPNLRECEPISRKLSSFMPTDAHFVSYANFMLILCKFHANPLIFRVALNRRLRQLLERNKDAQHPADGGWIFTLIALRSNRGSLGGCVR